MGPDSRPSTASSARRTSCSPARLSSSRAMDGSGAVMDMSFANQALCAEYVAANATKLERRVYDVPDDIDKEVARLKLNAMGIAIDTLTEEQERYLSSWEEGT